MFTSWKFLWLAVALYAIVVLLPGMFWGSQLIPTSAVSAAIMACLLFLSGLWVGSLLFPFSTGDCLPVQSDSMESGFTLLIVLQSIFAAYVLFTGPSPPLFAVFSGIDNVALALLREDAVKLNQDAVFVRVFAWCRDIFSPIVVVLGVQILRAGGRRMKGLAILGIAVAAFIGLWSGQKAVVVNYILAAVLFTAGNLRSLVAIAARAVPAAVVLVLAIFLATLPSLFSTGLDLGFAGEVVLRSVVHRVFVSPLEVSAAYIHALDDLEIISSWDVLPFVTSMWTPGILTIENRIGLEFFYSGISSAHANALAFAYAYVLAGYLGCFLGGLLLMLILCGCITVVRKAGSRFHLTAFSALLCYSVLDLLNSNFIGYLSTIVLYAVAFWVLGSIRPRHAAQARPEAIEASGPIESIR